MKAKVHELKTWPEYFAALLSGEKTFEFRKNDRDFQKGDVVVLREYDPKTDKYSGQLITALITYVLSKPPPPYDMFSGTMDICVFSIKPFAKKTIVDGKLDWRNDSADKAMKAINHLKAVTAGRTNGNLRSEAQKGNSDGSGRGS